MWINAHILSVENESSALFIIGYLRKVQVGTILTTTSNLQTRKTIDDNKKINHSFHLMTDICLDTFNKLANIDKH